RAGRPRPHSRASARPPLSPSAEPSRSPPYRPTGQTSHLPRETNPSPAGLTATPRLCSLPLRIVACTDDGPPTAALGRCPPGTPLRLARCSRRSFRLGLAKAGDPLPDRGHVGVEFLRDLPEAHTFREQLPGADLPFAVPLDAALVGTIAPV